MLYRVLFVFLFSNKKNKKGAKNQGSGGAGGCDGNKSVDSCCAPAPGYDQGNCGGGGGAINVNNMDLAKLKKAIDEMQSAKVYSKGEE